jgi:hypothetical protein
MLRFVKNEDVAVGAHGRDQIGLLRHVARLVDFAFVNHFLLNVEATFSAPTVAPDLFFLFIVATGVRFGDGVGELDFSDLEVVGVVAGGVGANEETVSRVVFARVALGELVSGGERT